MKDDELEPSEKVMGVLPVAVTWKVWLPLGVMPAEVQLAWSALVMTGAPPVGVGEGTGVTEAAATVSVKVCVTGG